MYYDAMPAYLARDTERSPNLNRFIVMTSAAKMPSSCWGTYRNVAVVEIDHAMGEGFVPAYISEHAKGVSRIVRHYGAQHAGRTSRCAYARAKREATELAESLSIDDLARRFAGADRR